MFHIAYSELLCFFVHAYIQINLDFIPYSFCDQFITEGYIQQILYRYTSATDRTISPVCFKPRSCNTNLHSVCTDCAPSTIVTICCVRFGFLLAPDSQELSFAELVFCRTVRRRWKRINQKMILINPDQSGTILNLAAETGNIQLNSILNLELF